MDDFTCTAAADSSAEGQLTATIRLPFTLTSAEQYELALQLCSFTPNWVSLDDLNLKVERKGETKTLVLAPVSDFRPHHLLRHLQHELREEFGSTDPNAKIDFTHKLGWHFRTGGGAKIEFSEQFAKLLNLPKSITNNSDTQRIDEIELTWPGTPDPMCYLSCDHIAQRFVLQKGNVCRVCDMIMLPDRFPTRVTHTPVVLRYHQLEAGCLHSLRFTVYNSDGLPVSSVRPELFLSVHIRRRHAFA